MQGRLSITYRAEIVSLLEASLLRALGPGSRSQARITMEATFLASSIPR